jgi:DNA repair protein RadA/Sms
MAKKSVIRYVCGNCGAIHLAWSGRCNNCGEWNTMVEEVVVGTGASGLKSALQSHRLSPTLITQALSVDQKRYLTDIKEVDEVLGGGIVPGSIILLAGQPGVGKSTLFLQVAQNLSKTTTTLYISGEESVQQVAMRAKRLGISTTALELVSSTSTDDIAATIASAKYKIVIIDSVQTLQYSQIASAPGSVSQISGSTQVIMAAAKQSNISIILSGHVTKEGSVAGPKILEHIVDVVLQLEGESYGGYKVLRSSKNRFGSTTEVAIFEMGEHGLSAVLNPSAALLSERRITDGSIVLGTIEGNRALLVEVQALVNRSGYGYPKRAASGIDVNRLNLLVAVLERRTKLQLSDKDIYINIVGGIRISDPAADLAVCMAIGSATKGFQLASNAVVFGEIGLSGEIRRVSYAEKRIAEAKKLDFSTIIGPPSTGTDKTIDYMSAPTIKDALNKFLSKEKG